MKKKTTFILFLACLLNGHIFGQYVASPGSAEIIQALKKLNTIGSVLYVAAHPDDENTRLLAYLAKEKNVRAGYISITRGDGGQNLVGKEQGEALGLIRTQELLAARRTDGAEQFFTRANDFGYSKNPEETFKFWNKDSVLGDLVWVIRKFRPDMIICRFPTTGEGGHGHHTASAILASEAFEAAADPKRYPEQLAYTTTWKTQRLFFNSFNFGSGNTTSPDQVQLDVGIFNPVLGKGYGEIAAESRSNHKSQGFGSARNRGAIIEYFKQLKGDSVKDDIFAGIDFTWGRLPGTSAVSKLVNECIHKFNPLMPSAIVADLVKLYEEIRNLPDGNNDVKYWKQLKLKEAETLIIACSGLWLEAIASDYSSTPGSKINLTIQAVKRNDVTVTLKRISFLDQADTITDLAMKQNQLYAFTHQETLPDAVPFSSPYWLNEKHDIGLYTVRDRRLTGKPENDPPATVKFEVAISGLALNIEKPAVYKYTDPVKGEVYRPFEVIPPVDVTIMEKVLVFADNAPRYVQFVIRANRAGVKGKLQVETPAGWSMRLNYSEFDLKEKGNEVILDGILLPSATAASGKMHASLLMDGINGKLYTKSIQRIEYDHIPYQFILSNADARLVKINLQKAKGNIGYIPGAGDEIPECLRHLGYQVTTLTDEMLTNDNLSVYSAIVTGIRAYNTNERLQVHYTKLMDYISKGGNLVVQYNTNSRIGPVIAKIGPYPFTISRDRVTDENAAVTFLKPTHSAITYPNKIDDNDFDGWVQERGIYFATEVDEHYESIISMHDPGEKDLTGSIITARYGKGNFVYTGLAFFRELPAGVPGAYRLFVNLLNLPALP